MIGIVDYGSGNTHAIGTIYKRLNIPYRIISQPSDLDLLDKLILPGVGAFDATMSQLNSSGLREKLDDLVINKKVPILGICVGMQVMGNGSEEGKEKGLGWIPGIVKQFDTNTIEFKPKLPHMGWNTVQNKTSNPLFEGLDNEFGFYFVHSYYFECEKEENSLATSSYGIEFTTVIGDNHIMATQFHPEKSHGNGIQLFKNFAEKDLC